DAAAAEDSLNASRAEIARSRFAIEAVRSAEGEEMRADVGQDNAAGAKMTSAADTFGDVRTVTPSQVEALAGRPAFSIAWDEGLTEPFRLREEAVLRADFPRLSDALKALDKQMAQELATRKRIDMSIAFQRTLIDTLNARVATRQQTIDLNVGTKINLYDAKEELEKSQAQLASDEGQLIETGAAVRELMSERTKTVSRFIADNEQAR